MQQPTVPLCVAKVRPDMRGWTAAARAVFLAAHPDGLVPCSREATRPDGLCTQHGRLLAVRTPGGRGRAGR